MNNLEDVLAMLKEAAMDSPSPSGVTPIKAVICPDEIGDRASSSFTTRCVYCKGDTTITVLTGKYLRWKGGAYVQAEWPLMSPDDRETMISGTHGVCFDAMWPEEDDDE